MCPRDQRFRDNDGGCGVAMTGVSNWRPRRRRRQRKMCPRSWRQQLRRRLRKQKIQRIWVNVSDGGGVGVFTGSGYWWWRRSPRQSKTGPQSQWWRRRRRQRMSNIRRDRRIEHNNWGFEDLGTMAEAVASQWRVWGIGDHDGGVGRGRWARGINNNNRGVRWGSRRDNAPEWTYLTAEAPVFL